MVAIVITVVPFLEFFDGMPILDSLGHPDAEGPKRAAACNGRQARRRFLARRLAPATHHLAGDGAANDALEKMTPVPISVLVSVSGPVAAFVLVLVNNVFLVVVVTATAPRATADLTVVLFEVVVTSTTHRDIAAFADVIVIVLAAATISLRLNSGDLSVFNDGPVHNIVGLRPAPGR